MKFLFAFMIVSAQVGLAGAQEAKTDNPDKIKSIQRLAGISPDFKTYVVYASSSLDFTELSSGKVVEKISWQGDWGWVHTVVFNDTKVVCQARKSSASPWSIIILDRKTGEKLRTISPGELSFFSADGRYLLIVPQTLYDLTVLKATKIEPVKGEMPEDVRKRLYGAKAEDKTLIKVEKDTVHLMGADNKVLQSWIHPDVVLVTATKNDLVATFEKDKVIRIWKKGADRPVAVFKDVTVGWNLARTPTLTFSEDGAMVLLRARDTGRTGHADYDRSEIWKITAK